MTTCLGFRNVCQFINLKLYKATYVSKFYYSRLVMLYLLPSPYQYLQLLPSFDLRTDGCVLQTLTARLLFGFTWL